MLFFIFKSCCIAEKGPHGLALEWGHGSAPSASAIFELLECSANATETDPTAVTHATPTGATNTKRTESKMAQIPPSLMISAQQTEKLDVNIHQIVKLRLIDSPTFKYSREALWIS